MLEQMLLEYREEYEKSLADKGHLLAFYDPENPNDREMLEVINADISYLAQKIGEVTERLNGNEEGNND